MSCNIGRGGDDKANGEVDDNTRAEPDGSNDAASASGVGGDATCCCCCCSCGE